MGESILIVILIIVVLVLGMFYIPRTLMKRATRQVVAIFRENGATSPEGAKSMETLGLVRPAMLDRMFKMRDYKPHAVRLLVQAGVIQPTTEGTVYLSEEALENSPVKRFAGLE